MAGSLNYLFDERRIFVDWRYSVPGYTGSEHVYDASMHGSWGEYAVPYRPTTVACSSTDTALIGGVTDDGFTIIEEWVFDAPMIPRAETSTSGGLILPNVVPRVLSKRLVFRSDYTPGQYVGAIFQNRVDVSRPYFTLNGSKVVAQLDTDQLSYEIVASVDGDGLNSPDLAQLGATGEDQIEVVGAARLKDSGGFAFWLGYQADSEQRTVMFLDSDEDGDLDSTLTLDYQQWGNSLYSDMDAVLSSR